MGLVARALRSSGPTHGRPPCSSLASLGDVVPIVQDLVMIQLISLISLLNEDATGQGRHPLNGVL
jgi:hypothetical protein